MVCKKINKILQLLIFDFLCTIVHNIIMNNLTQKQKEFFENLKNHYGLRALSSYEKIKEVFSYKSKNSIKQYIEALKKKI